MRSTFRSLTWPRYCIEQGFLCRVRRWSPQRYDVTSPSRFLDLCAVPLRQLRHCSDNPDVSFPSPYVYWTVSVGLFFVPVDIVRLDQEIDSWTPCLFCLHLHHDINFCKRLALWVVDYSAWKTLASWQLRVSIYQNNLSRSKLEPSPAAIPLVGAVYLISWHLGTSRTTGPTILLPPAHRNAVDFLVRSRHLFVLLPYKLDWLPTATPRCAATRQHLWRSWYQSFHRSRVEYVWACAA